MEEIEKSVYVSEGVNKEFKEFLKKEKVKVKIDFKVILLSSKAWTLGKYSIPKIIPPVITTSFVLCNTHVAPADNEKLRGVLQEGETGGECQDQLAGGLLDDGGAGMLHEGCEKGKEGEGVGVYLPSIFSSSR